MRRFTFTEGEYYHLYNRGTDKRTIFLTHADYQRFMALMFLANSFTAVDLGEAGSTLSKIIHIDRGNPLVAIGAYCLMPNHYHFLVRETTLGGISKFMQKMSTGYTMYFNKLHDRTGNLFQGKFKAAHATDDRYLKYLFAYIHLNPAKLTNSPLESAGTIADSTNFVRSYPYSSYKDYITARDENAVLARAEFPEYFQNADEFENEMTEWLQFAQLPGHQ